jgi:hypothetical protein
MKLLPIIQSTTITPTKTYNKRYKNFELRKTIASGRAQNISPIKDDIISSLITAATYKGITAKGATNWAETFGLNKLSMGSKLSRGGSIAGIGLGIAAIAGMSEQSRQPYTNRSDFFKNSAIDTLGGLKYLGGAGVGLGVGGLKTYLTAQMAPFKFITGFLYQLTNYLGSQGSVFGSLKGATNIFIKDMKSAIKPITEAFTLIPKSIGPMTKDQIDAERVKLFAERKIKYDSDKDKKYFDTPEGYIDLTNREREERDKKEERAREFRNEQQEKEWAKNLKSLQSEVFDKNLRKSTIKSLDRMAEDRDYTVASINKQMVDMFYRRQKDGLGAHGTILGGMETPAFSQSYQKEGEKAKKEYNAEMERLQTDQLGVLIEANMGIQQLIKKFDKYNRLVAEGLIPEDVAAGVEL